MLHVMSLLTSFTSVYFRRRFSAACGLCFSVSEIWSVCHATIRIFLLNELERSTNLKAAVYSYKPIITSVTEFMSVMPPLF